jgi:heptosyltransferase-3
VKFLPTSSIKTILISRTDSIGDVVLTLPLCVWLKNKFPQIRIIFLCKNYTKPVISCIKEVDEILCWEEINLKNKQEKFEFFVSKKIDVCIHVFPNKEIAKLIKSSKIPFRIGTSHRLFHFLTCNVRLNFTRKNSIHHEAQLNFELLRPMGLKTLPKIDEINSWMKTSFFARTKSIPKEIEHIKNAIILHPKSQGSALEWPINKYIELANKLLEQGQKVVFSGTENEGILFRHLLPKNLNCLDLTGKLNLSEFIYFISQQKALLACSTGPYHLAGVLGIKAIGLFSPRKPIHPGRWKALGTKTFALVYDENCIKCKNGEKCSCIEKIEVDEIIKLLNV